MKRTIFIKAETSDGKAWADTCETINNYYSGSVDDIDIDLKQMEDFDQKADIYTRISTKVLFGKSSEGNNSFDIKVPLPRPNRKGQVTFDMETVFEAFELKKYRQIYFGYVFPEEGSSTETDAIEKAFFFARNSDGRFINIETNEEISESNKVQLAIWFSVFRVKGSGFYYVSLNTNLLDVAEDLSFIANENNYILLDTHDGSFRDSVFKPSLSDNAEFIDDTMIVVKEGNEFTLNTFGWSKVHYQYKEINDELIPRVDIRWQSTLNVQKDDHIFTIKLDDKNNGLFKYKLITESQLDYGLSGDEALQYKFLVIKLD